MAKPNRDTLMFTILAWLQGRGGAHVSEIVQHFGVSEQQIRNAVETLGEAWFGQGMPDENMGLDWYQYDEFGYVIFQDMNGVFEKLGLSDDETIAFVTGLVYLSYMLPADMREVALSAALKLLAARGLELDFSKLISLEDATIGRQRDVIQSAISKGSSLSFKYVNNNSQASTRTVFPLAVEQAGRHWLMRSIDLDLGQRRSFRLDRIEDIELGALHEPRSINEQKKRQTVWIQIDPAGEHVSESAAEIKKYKGRHRAIFDVFDERWMVTQMLLLAPWVLDTNREDLLAKARQSAQIARANRDLFIRT